MRESTYSRLITNLLLIHTHPAVTNYKLFIEEHTMISNNQ